MIIVHFAHDPYILKTCLGVCRSWKAAAIPQLYHTLTLAGGGPETCHSQMEPLSNLRELGLIRSVKEIRVKQERGSRWSIPGPSGITFPLSRTFTL